MTKILRQYGIPLVFATAGSTCIMAAEMSLGSRKEFVTLYLVGLALDAVAVGTWVYLIKE